MRALSLVTLVVVKGLLVASVASAQTGTPPPPRVEPPPVEIRYEKRTVIDISDTLIEGVVVGPSTTAVRGGRRPTFKSMIRLRPDFRKELSATPAALSTSR
jgi:hypothetical protein